MFSGPEGNRTKLLQQLTAGPRFFAVRERSGSSINKGRAPGRGVNKEKTEPMKKADLVDVVAQQKNLPRPQVEATIDALIEAVAEGLAKGDRIDLRGFGAFAVRESAARAGRNPQTGETIQIAARRVPTFKAGKELRDRVNRPAS
jgi:integration host factor beta subunit